MVKKTPPVWALASAKARFSEVVERAKEEPQIIERRGKAVGVVVGMDLFAEAEQRALLGSAEHRMSAFLEASRKIREAGGVDLEVPRRQARKSPFPGR